MVHGNRGREPVHKLSERIRNRVLELAQGPYQGLNQHLLQEVLEEREGVRVSRPSIWRILTAAGVRSPRRRRPPRHRHRRERYPQGRMILQIDGSRHDSLEGRSPCLSLMAAIDDATRTVPFALFRQREDAQGYMLPLETIIRSKGVPLDIYSDRHGIFQRSPREAWSLEGEQRSTQFGRALEQLGIQSIFALSPQAKGRIERLRGTFQDRLVSEWRLAGATSLEQANQMVEHFLEHFNAQFAVPTAQKRSAYRGTPEELDLDGVLCFKYRRKVAADNTVRFDGRTLQLLPGLERLSYAHAQVEVQE